MPDVKALTLILSVALTALAGCPPAHSNNIPPVRPAASPGVITLELIPDPLYAAPLLTLQGELHQILFHLNIHNKGARPQTIRWINLVSLRGGEVLRRDSLDPPLLRRRLRPVAWIEMRDRQSIAAAHRARGLLWRPKGDVTIPARGAVALTHLLSVGRADVLPDAIRCTVVLDGDEPAPQTTIKVRRFKQQTRLRLPFDGTWWPMGAHLFYEQHAQGFLASQNFAYDLGVLGPGASTCSGDRTLNASYHANGKPILAAADGEVVALHDGVKENEPVGRRPTWQAILRSPRDLAGNFIVLRHQEGEYSAYMHLRPGLSVKLGDKVEAGQRLGQCGNSGNSLETHVHFQLQDGPDIFRSSGLPARFSDFTLHLGGLKLYVPPERPSPLPGRWMVEPGRAAGAVEISKVLR